MTQPVQTEQPPDPGEQLQTQVQYIRLWRVSVRLEHASLAALAVFAGSEGHWDETPADAVDELENGLIEFIHEQYPEIIEELQQKQELDEALTDALSGAIERFKTENRPEEGK